MSTIGESGSVSRRDFGKGTLGLGALATGLIGSGLAAEDAESAESAKLGRLNQSLCKWCYDKNLSLDELCVHAKEMGLVGIDLLGPKDFETLKKHELVCTMVTSHKLTDGLCDPKYWDEALESINASIEAASSAGFRNVICFSGNARGIDRKIGMKNCAEALRKIVSVAEKKKVILNMELLNSRVDHADYMCDLSAWGIELCKHPFDSEEPSVLWSLPYGGQPGSPRDRRDTGDLLSADRQGDSREWL